MTTQVPFEILNQAIEYYKSGLPLLKASTKAGVSYEYLRRKLKAAGLIRSNKINSRKYSVDDQYFQSINTERKAYWLGFIYADGYITKCRNQKLVGISLKSSDKLQLEALRNDLQATYPIKEYTTESFGVEVQYVRLLMTSEQMYDSLLKKGVLERKSLILQFPLDLPCELVHHFIRGYFDGDGSFARRKENKDDYAFKVLGTQEFLQELSTKVGFPNRTLRKRWKHSDKNNWVLEIDGKRQVLTIGDYMYQGATMFMSRKYDRYCRMQAQP